jgi:hypothetical protein
MRERPLKEWPSRERIQASGRRDRGEAAAPGEGYVVVFEGDGETGCFYGLDVSRPADNPIVDALHLYNVSAVADRENAYSIEIRWAEDRNRAGLFIADRCQAVFDFDEKIAVGRSGFPPPGFSFPECPLSAGLRIFRPTASRWVDQR